MSLLSRAKALLLKAVPAGARWITVHPNGQDKGQPVLVQEDKKGSGVWRVIGGAGGKLNYLKLRGVKSEADYKKEAAERQSQRRETAKEQRERDKESGIYQAKKDAKAGIDQQRRSAEHEYIQTVAKAMGWKEEEIRFPEEAYANASEAAQQKAAQKHHAALLKKAREAVDTQRQRLVIDAEARATALGEIPLETEDPNVISVDDLAPVKTSNGLGFATDYKARAEAAGATEEQVAAEAREIEQAKPEEQRAVAEKRRQSAESIAKELEELREPGPRNAKAKLVDAQQAVELLKAEKQLKAIQKKAREANKEIDKSAEPKAYVLEVGKEAVDEKVQQDLENDLRTLKTRAFLSEVGKVAGEDEAALGRHVAVGAYNSVNALSLASAGAALVDRSVVDVLGVAGAAQVLARRLHADLSADELADVQSGLEAFHVDHYMKASEDALREAMEWQKVANEIDVGTAVDGQDLVQAQEMNNKRRDAVRHAQRIMGTTLGEMESNAALIVALKQGRRDTPLQVSLGDVSTEDAIRQARAIGLERGDYQIEAVGANRFLTVAPQGLDRLSKPVNREDLAATRAALDIIEGHQDEENWLPMGIANRPDLAVKTPPGVAPRLAEPFTAGENLKQSIRDYIGGRTADGDPPSDVMADLLSQDTLDKVPPEQRPAFFEALDKIAPMKDDEGKPLRAETHQQAFEGLADEFVASRYGQSRAPLHRQQVPVDHVSVEALHRALAAEPTGVLAYKPVGELGPKDQRSLRDYFAQHIAKDNGRTADLRTALEEMEKNEPEREAEDMFGEKSTNPEWTSWKQKRDAAAEELNTAALNWGKYVKVMGSPTRAYQAVQDLVRGNVAKTFHETYNTLRPEAPLTLGRAPISDNLNHLDAVDPEARERRLEEHRRLIDSLRERVAGRYASGSVTDKVEEAREAVAAMQQSQMGFFAAEPEPAEERALSTDERHTLGHAAERQIAGMMSVVGQNFHPGKPAALWAPSMNGKYINQQRAVKLIDRNKRVVLAQGVGSGKTMIGLGAFSHAHAQGKAKRGLFVVPSIVQGQFGGEALRYLEPGKYKWHIEPGASREERIAAYKDPSNHFSVVTHQSFRDDMIHLAAQQEGIDEREMVSRVSAMDSNARKEWARGVMDRAGMDHDYLFVDEGHDLLNRAGKEDSLLANVVDSVAHNTQYYVNASADPVKNDPSEIYDLLHKMDPARYSDQKAFMRRYGVDTPASKEELRRELARYFYPGKIESGVKADKREIPVSLSDPQRKAIENIDAMSARARLARMKGQVDVEAMRALSPVSFEKVDPAHHEAVAKRLQESLGIIREGAVQRAIDAHESSAKLDHLSGMVKDRSGKPGVIFARSLDAVHQIEERLKREGHRVVTLTGEHSSKEKEARRLAFKPEKGEATADVLVCSDAGAVGLNAQRGQWLIQYDTPKTAKTHAQRNGRIDRLGQKNNVELLDLVSDHPVERKNRKRLADKYDLRGILTTPLEGLDDTGVALYLARARMEREQQNGSLF